MKILSAFLLIVFSVSVYSQTDSIIKLNLPEVLISQSGNYEDETYGFTNKRNSFLLYGRMLIYDSKKYSYNIPLENITKIQFRDGTYFWKTAKIIGAAGGFLGLLMGITLSVNAGNESNGRVVYLVPIMTISGLFGAAMLGGLIGSTIPYFDSYIQKNKDLDKRQAYMKKILKKYNNRK